MATMNATVEELLDSTVQEIISGSEGETVLRREAEAIWNELADNHQEELISYLQDNGVSLLREQLRVRLALHRSRSRKAVFSEEDLDVHPFQERMAVEGYRWVARGDMLKPDWQFIVDNRCAQAEASLFEVALARLVIKKLPDDVTPTRSVMSEQDMTKMEERALASAQAAVIGFAKR